MIKQQLCLFSEQTTVRNQLQTRLSCDKDVHPVEHGYMRFLIESVGMRMTQVVEEAHVHLVLENNGCNLVTRPTVWAGLLYNDDPQHTAQLQGKHFFPPMFSR